MSGGATPSSPSPTQDLQFRGQGVLSLFCSWQHPGGDAQIASARQNLKECQTLGTLCSGCRARPAAWTGTLTSQALHCRHQSWISKPCYQSHRAQPLSAQTPHRPNHTTGCQTQISPFCHNQGSSAAPLLPWSCPCWCPSHPGVLTFTAMMVPLCACRTFSTTP